MVTHRFKREGRECQRKVECLGKAEDTPSDILAYKLLLSQNQDFVMPYS